MPTFYPGQPDYIDKLNELATAAEIAGIGGSLDGLTASVSAAAASATAAAISATAAAASATAAAASVTAIGGSVTAAAASATAANTSATNAAASATAASNSATTASTHATNAAASATAASNSATTASTHATNAAASATAASASATSAAASYDSFDDRYLGAKSSDPTLDNDGNTLITGASYWSTPGEEMRIWSGSAWIASQSFSSSTNAAASATAAAASATAASNSATTASTHATNAAVSATAASNSATTASTHATNAANSANTATTQATNASSSATLASQWATQLVTPVSGGEYSAKYWAAQAAASVTGQLVYRGSWSAAGGSYPGSPALGDYYKVSAAGTVSSIEYEINDSIIYNGTTWDKIDSTESVSSVAGRTGVIVLTKTDVGLGNVDNTSDINKPVSTAQQTALDLKANLIGPSFTTPDIGVATGTSFNSITGLSSSTPVVAGTGTAGVGTTVARADHVHPAQANITGNAATVTTNANLTGVVTSTGNATSIANGAITNAMLANSAVANLTGTNSGDNAVNTLYSGLVSNATHTGDVTGATLLTIATNAVTNAKAAQIAVNTIKGRITAGTGDVEDLTAANVRTIINVADGANNYVHTTNANLTGPITSIGNATSIANQTGTGTTFVMSVSPTLTTPNIGVATGTSFQGIIGNVTPAAGTFTTFNSTGVSAVTVNDASAALTVTQLGAGDIFIAKNEAIDATPFVIDNLGNVIIRHTEDMGGGILQVKDRKISVMNFADSDIAAGTFNSYKSRSETPGTFTIVQDSDELGVLNFRGDDGADFFVAAAIAAMVDGTPGANDMPGRLVFSTTSDGADSPTERVRIDSKGRTTFSNSIVETKTAPTISSGTLSLDLASGALFAVSLNAAITTLTLANPPASGNLATFVLEFTADGTSRAVTWPAAVKWAGGTAPTLTSTSTKRDAYAFYTYDGGTTYIGSIIGQNF